MRDENWVKWRGFDKSQISAALRLAANSVLFDAKNAGNCIFQIFLGGIYICARVLPPPHPSPDHFHSANLELLVKRAVVWVLTVANKNKTNMAGGSEHGGREQNECLTRLLFKS